MARVGYAQAKKIVKNAESQIERVKYSITKNYNDMDLQNNTVQDDIEVIIEEMLKECRELDSILQGLKIRG